MPVLSIGALSQATGVPLSTLRTWAQRYDFPPAERTAGGHRVYAVEAVELVALARRALDRGHRPAQALRLDLAELRALLGETAPRERPADDWIDAAERMDSAALQLGFERELLRLGALAFLEQRAGAFLVAVGDRWEAGTLTVAHEHFASEHLERFLAARWSALRAPTNAPVAVLATLPLELHGLGLHFAALTLALAGWRVVFLGTQVPASVLVECAAGAQAVVLSVSSHAPARDVSLIARKLVVQLGPTRALVLGGAGAPSIEGAVQPEGLTALHRWATAFAG